MKKHPLLDRFFLTGFFSGLGFGIFALEAFKSQKRPLFYLGGLFLIILGSTLFRSFKKKEVESKNGVEKKSELVR